jgi:hypothetical protein
MFNIISPSIPAPHTEMAALYTKINTEHHCTLVYSTVRAAIENRKT